MGNFIKMLDNYKWYRSTTEVKFKVYIKFWGFFNLKIAKITDSLKQT